MKTIIVSVLIILSPVFAFSQIDKFKVEDHEQCGQENQTFLDLMNHNVQYSNFVKQAKEIHYNIFTRSDIERKANVVIFHPFNENVEEVLSMCTSLVGELSSQYSDLDNTFNVCEVIKYPDEMLTLIDLYRDTTSHPAPTAIIGSLLQVEFNEYFTEQTELYKADILHFIFPQNYGPPAGNTPCLSRYQEQAHRITTKWDPIRLNDDMVQVELAENIPWFEWEGDKKIAMGIKVINTAHEIGHAFNASSHQVGDPACVDSPTRNAYHDTIAVNGEEIEYASINYSVGARAFWSTEHIFRNELRIMISENELIFDWDGNQTKYGSFQEDNFNHPDGTTARDYWCAFLNLNQHIDNTTSVIDLESETEMLISPNPINTNDFLSIQNNSKLDLIAVDIIDSRGILRETIESRILSKTSGLLSFKEELASGIYVIRFHYSNNYIKVRKLVVVN